MALTICVLNTLLLLFWCIYAQDVYLNSSYNDNHFNLSQLSAGSYVINQSVIFGENTHVFIENGVQIRFTGDYLFIINGSIDLGCFDQHNNSNTPTQIQIYSDIIGYGGIDITGAQTSKFCHTLFLNMKYGVKFIMSTNLMINNCQFINIQNTAITIETNMMMNNIQFINNEIHNCSKGILIQQHNITDFYIYIANNNITASHFGAILIRCCNNIQIVDNVFQWNFRDIILDGSLNQSNIISNISIINNSFNHFTTDCIISHSVTIQHMTINNNIFSIQNNQAKLIILELPKYGNSSQIHIVGNLLDEVNIGSGILVFNTDGLYIENN
eukprot:393054_1